MRPEARTAGLLVEELGGEAVIYDLDSNMVHRLNREAFQVWQACDGQRTIATIAQTMSDAPGNTGDRLALVEVAVHQLREAGLLVQHESQQGARRLRTRRELLTWAGRAGAVVGGLVLVQTIAAPTPTMAASPEPCEAILDPKTGDLECRGDCVKKETKLNGTTLQECVPIGAPEEPPTSEDTEPPP